MVTGGDVDVAFDDAPVEIDGAAVGRAGVDADVDGGAERSGAVERDARAVADEITRVARAGAAQDELGGLGGALDTNITGAGEDRVEIRRAPRPRQRARAGELERD